MKRVAICKLCKERIRWLEEYEDWFTDDQGCQCKIAGRRLAWNHQPLVFNDYLNEVEKLNTK